MAGQKSNTHQRDLGYRAVIPFYILWDTDLNGNDLRFYGQIEQMESNPSPNVNASFSYQWIADMLGINRRNAINIANKLKKKGYITRTKINQKEYLWNTVKKGVLVSPSDTSLVSSSDTALVSSSDTQNTSKLKTNKENNISESDDSPATDLNDFVQQVVDVYHEKLPEMPKIKIITDEVKKAVKTLINEWSKIKGVDLTINGIGRYFEGRRELTPWILEPYKTREGNLRRSRLINLIRVDNVRKFYNGDYTNG